MLEFIVLLIFNTNLSLIVNNQPFIPVVVKIRSTKLPEVLLVDKVVVLVMEGRSARNV